MDDLTAVALGARSGDRRALEALIRATQVDVWRLCSHLGSPGETEDLTQETYLRVVRALPSFRGDAPVRTWVLSIARRTCADSVRRRVRDRQIQERVERRHEVTSTAVGDEMSDASLQIDRLPDEFRQALLLTQVLGLSYAEAAEVSECPIGTIRSRVARARDLLTRVDDAREANG